MSAPDPTGAAGQAYLLETVASHAAAVRERPPGPAARRRTTTCILHALYCAVSGRDLPWSRQATSLSRPGAEGGATVWATGARAATDDAVFVNAAHAQSTMGEDMHAPSLTHPGSIVVPVAFGLGEETDATKEQMIRAVIAGYDVMCKLGTALKTPEFAGRGFRPSGIFGPLGAAAAASMLLGLDEETTCSAMGIAASASAGLREWAHAGSTEIFFHNALAARNGLMAARLAAAGVSGPRSALEGEAGMNVAFAGGTAVLADIPTALAKEPAVTEVYFKRYPACGAVQTVIRLTSDLRRDHGISPADVTSVTVRTHHHGKDNPGCDNPGPWGSLPQAQMSNQMGVALALAVDSPVVSDYSRFDSPETIGLASRVRVLEEPRCSRIYPAQSRAEVDITLRDGRTVSGDLTGVFQLQDDEVTEVARHALASCADGAEQVVDAVLTAPPVASVRSLLSALNQHPNKGTA